MGCKKPNCCQKAKAVKTEMTMKATAQLQQEVAKEMELDDKDLDKLLEKEQDEDKS